MGMPRQDAGPSHLAVIDLVESGSKVEALSHLTALTLRERIDPAVLSRERQDFHGRPDRQVVTGSVLGFKSYVAKCYTGANSNLCNTIHQAVQRQQQKKKETKGTDVPHLWCQSQTRMRTSTFDIRPYVAIRVCFALANCTACISKPNNFGTGEPNRGIPLPYIE